MDIRIIPTGDDLSLEDRRILESLEVANRITPNIYAKFGYSEEDLISNFGLQNAGATLSLKEKDAVNIIVSEVTGCKLCLSEHTFAAILHGFSEIEIDNVRKGYSSDIKLDTIVALAKEILKNTGNISKDAIYDFFDAGYTKENLVDLILLITKNPNEL